MTDDHDNDNDNMPGQTPRDNDGMTSETRNEMSSREALRSTLWELTEWRVPERSLNLCLEVMDDYVEDAVQSRLSAMALLPLTGTESHREPLVPPAQLEPMAPAVEEAREPIVPAVAVEPGCAGRPEMKDHHALTTTDADTFTCLACHATWSITWTAQERSRLLRQFSDPSDPTEPEPVDPDVVEMAVEATAEPTVEPGVVVPELVGLFNRKRVTPAEPGVAEALEAAGETALCGRCLRVKLLTEFNRDRSRRNGHRRTCRSCDHDYERERRKNRPSRSKRSLL